MGMFGAPSVLPGLTNPPTNHRNSSHYPHRLHQATPQRPLARRFRAYYCETICEPICEMAHNLLPDPPCREYDAANRLVRGR